MIVLSLFHVHYTICEGDFQRWYFRVQIHQKTEIDFIVCNTGHKPSSTFVFKHIDVSTKLHSNSWRAPIKQSIHIKDH